MKKALTLFLLASLLVSPLFAQKKKDSKEPVAETKTETTTEAKPATSKEFEVHENVFKNALKLGDGVVAKQSLYYMMALRPDMENLKDSLAFIYFNLSQFPQCIALANEILTAKENNILLEMRAVSYKSLGGAKESLEDYESLYKNTKNVLYLYEIATLQYALKRYGEAAATTEKILADEKSKEAKVAVTVGQNRSQEVSLPAAVYNLRGVMAMELKDTKAAKQNFTKAKEAFPDFVLAENNLKVLEQTEKENAKPASGKK